MTTATTKTTNQNYGCSDLSLSSCHRRTHEEKDSFIVTPPPLDSVTVTTCSTSGDPGTFGEEDGGSSCSSLSCDEDEQEQRQRQKPRTIFGEYWTVVNGKDKAPFYRSAPVWRSSHMVPPSSVSVPATGQSSSSTTLAMNPQEQHQPEKQTRRNIFVGGTAAQSSRRALLGTSPSSASDLQLLASLAQDRSYLNRGLLVERKVRSAPGFLERPSALRQGRFSSKGNNKNNLLSGMPARSVSFNHQVRVTLFAPAGSAQHEQWAQEGWQDWFF